MDLADAFVPQENSVRVLRDAIWACAHPAVLIASAPTPMGATSQMASVLKAAQTTTSAKRMHSV